MKILFLQYELVCMCVHALMHVINIIINVCALNIVNIQYLLLHACTYGTQEHMLYNTTLTSEINSVWCLCAAYGFQFHIGNIFFTILVKAFTYL